MNIIEKARVFATAAHHAAGNARKYTGEPYINHPAAVVELVSNVPHTPEMIAAAWLHDTVEDTYVSLDLIKFEFGEKVADLVYWLTNKSTREDGNRATRKAINRLHIAQASPEAKTIKLADLLDNTASIIKHEPNFAKVYMAEKAELLKVLTEGDKTLWDRANIICWAWEQPEQLKQKPQEKQMSTREIFANVLRGADNGTDAIHANRAAVLAHANRALTLAGPKGRLP